MVCQHETNEAVMNMFITIFDRLVHTLAYYVGGLLLVALVLVTNADVTLRKTHDFFGNPLFYGSHDISKLLLVLIVGVSLGYGARTGANVSVAILESFVGRQVTRWTQSVVKLFGAGLIALASYQLFRAGIASVRYKEGTQELNIMLEPYYYAFAVGVGIFAIALAAEAIQLAVNGKVTLLIDESSEMTAADETEAGNREPTQ